MKQSVFVIRNMDCPAEKALIRKRLGTGAGDRRVGIQSHGRRLTVTHTLGDKQPIYKALREIAMEAASEPVPI